MSFDFSSVFTMQSYDKNYSLNVSVYLDVVYFNVFDNRNKKLVTKLIMSDALMFSLKENFNTMSNLNLDDPYIEELHTIKVGFNPETKQRFIVFSVSIGKDIEINKYNPFYLRIKDPKKELDIMFPMKYSGSVSTNIDTLYTVIGKSTFKYYKYLFTTKLFSYKFISMDLDQSLKRKEKIRNQSKI